MPVQSEESRHPPYRGHTCIRYADAQIAIGDDYLDQNNAIGTEFLSVRQKVEQDSGQVRLVHEQSFWYRKTDSYNQFDTWPIVARF